MQSLRSNPNSYQWQQTNLPYDSSHFHDFRWTDSHHHPQDRKIQQQQRKNQQQAQQNQQQQSQQQQQQQQENPVDDLVKLSSGQTAREVTKRLTEVDINKRSSSLERLRNEHAKVYRKNTVRPRKELEAYVSSMLHKGEDRRKRELAKIAREMYPDPNPKILNKSRQLAEKKRSELEHQHHNEDHHVQHAYEYSTSSSARHHQQKHKKQKRSQSASSQQNASVSAAFRSRSPSFRPANLTPQRKPDLFLVSAATQRMPSPRQSHPLSEEERKERFTELSKPVRPRSASSGRPPVATSSSSSSSSSSMAGVRGGEHERHW